MPELRRSATESKECYDVIAGQIDREDGLTNYRLTWTLTLNGFLFAALGFLGSKDTLDPSLLKFFHWALPWVGSVVSVAGLLGVGAAFFQIRYLANEWRKLNDGRWPRPFGGKYVFWFGAAPCFGPPVILIVVWVGLFFTWK